MTRPARSTARRALGGAIALVGFASAALLDNTALALVGSVGLIAVLLTLERVPRSRD